MKTDTKHLIEQTEEIKRKLKEAFDYGPGAPDVVLTAEQAAIVYRQLFPPQRHRG